MIEEVRRDFGEAIEKSGKAFATDPFFMALLLAHQRMIRRLRDELKALGVEIPDSGAMIQTAFD